MVSVTKKEPSWDSVISETKEFIVSACTTMGARNIKTANISPFIVLLQLHPSNTRRCYFLSMNEAGRNLE